MESILFTGNQLPSTRSDFLANSPNFTALTTEYLTDYVDHTWHIFAPRQSLNYVQYDNTFRSWLGRYLLLTGTNPSDRGIIVSQRYNLKDHGGIICFSLAVYKASDENILEIYQGESFNDTHGTKIWDIHRKTNDWETFQILASPQQNTSIDIFFYIVSFIFS